MKKKMHLMSIMLNSNMNHTILSWGHPDSRQGTEFTSPAFWQETATILERGKFDGFLFADILGAAKVYKNSLEATIKHGVYLPTHDPLVLVPYLASVTEKLGFVVTMSTNAYPPYVSSRALSTLDHLTKGRIGWNLVTGHHLSEYHNLGQTTFIPHDERYDRADEYLEVCRKLWNSWEPDAVVIDMENGIYADPDKIQAIHYKGKYFSCEGPSSVLPSPQGNPVVIQAGSSGRGRDFSAKNAEAAFSIQGKVEGMRRYSDDMRQRVKSLGKNPEDFKVLFGIQVIVGDTEAEAEEKRQYLKDRIPLEAALSKLSSSLGYDFSKQDPDEPIRFIKTDGSQGLFEMFAKYGENITVTEAAKIFGLCAGMPQIVGTGKQVAEKLEKLMNEGGGDGFVITPTYDNKCWTEFVDHVVPELQNRGIYREDYTGSTLREHLLEN